MFNHIFLSMFNYNAMLKKIFLIKSVRCDISNFSEFHQNYESAGLILFGESCQLCQLCNLTAGCNFNNQLLFTAFCSTSVGWIKTNGVIYIPIVFCPLTVKLKGKQGSCPKGVHSLCIQTYGEIFLLLLLLHPSLQIPVSRSKLLW